MKKKILHDAKWLRLVDIQDDAGDSKWVYTTRRKPEDLDAPAKADAAVIIPIHIDEDGKSTLVLTKEYRLPIGDYEYGFAAGLIDEGESVAETVVRELAEETGYKATVLFKSSPLLYSTAGMSDESCVVACVACSGEDGKANLQDSEDIETLRCDVDGLKELLARDDIKWSAKAWPLAFAVAMVGQIEILLRQDVEQIFEV